MGRVRGNTTISVKIQKHINFAPQSLCDLISIAIIFLEYSDFWQYSRQKRERTFIFKFAYKYCAVAMAIVGFVVSVGRAS